MGFCILHAQQRRSEPHSQTRWHGHENQTVRQVRGKWAFGDAIDPSAQEQRFWVALFRQAGILARDGINRAEPKFAGVPLVSILDSVFAATIF
jgi:hypothetical protein